LSITVEDSPAYSIRHLFGDKLQPLKTRPPEKGFSGGKQRAASRFA